MPDVLLLRAEDFSCSLDVLYEGLDISKLQFLIKQYQIFSAVNFLKLLVIKTPDPDPKHLLVSELQKKGVAGLHSDP